ncbi:Uncharacterised protein [Enterobacter kobei]|nr:Uncharacterised protein [Enterobacter kobei]
MLRGSNKEDLIASFDNGRALRADRSVVTENGGDARINMGHMFAHGGQRVANQWPTVISLNYSQTDFPFGKVHHLQCPWIFDQAIDIVDNQLFRRDEMIDWNRF